IVRNSVVFGVYEKVVDRESAYERLKGKAQQSPAPGANPAAGANPAQPQADKPWYENLPSINLPGSLGGSGRRGDTAIDAMVKSAARSIGSSVGRQIIRGVLGSLLGGSSRR